MTAGNKTNHEEGILRDEVAQLYSLAPIGFIASIFNSLLVYVVMRGVLPHRVVTAWVAAVLLITALRAFLVLSFRLAAPGAASAPYWRNWFLFGTALVGLAWGGLGFLPLSFPLAHQVFYAFVLGGMAAGASSMFSKVRYGDAFFTIPAILPLGASFFLYGDRFHSAMGGMTVLYLVLITRISRHNFQVNRTSLLLRYENRDMIADLKTAQEAMEALNAQLRSEIAAKLEAEAELREHHRQLERTVEQRTEELTRTNQLLKGEIEERKQVESALLASRERLVLAQKAGRVGVFDWDLQGGDVVWTAELEELFGLKPGEFERSYEGWASRVHPDDLPGLEENFRRRLEERATHLDFMYRFIRSGTEVRWIAANASVTYGDDGTPLRMIGTNLDVTEMKEAELDLVAAKEAAEAGSLAKSEFLANMSHEMRTPLAGALGMITLVLEMGIGAEERQLLEMAKRSAESLLRIIADLLDFSRLEAGAMTFERTAFSLAEVVNGAVEMVFLSARERGLDLTFEIAEELPERLVGDPGRLRQVLVNLLGNAVKFTESGEIVVTVSRRREFERDFVLFSVKDTGIGIPSDQLERIFGKFTQLDTTLAGKRGGTGLGLALSRHIVEAMGGRIWAESEIGVGSTFHFTIPENTQELNVFSA